MLKFVAALAASAFVVLGASAALAQQQDFTVENRTGYVIVSLKVSPAAEPRWGPDILGREVLAKGESAQVNFERAESVCLWDLRVTYDDGDVGEWRGVNLCEVSTVVLIAD